MLATHVGVLAVLLPIQLPANALATAEDSLSTQAPVTQVGDLDGITVSWLHSLSVVGMNQQIEDFSVSLPLSLCL